MSSEENIAVKEKISLSSSTEENLEAGSQQTQSAIFLTNGHKEVPGKSFSVFALLVLDHNRVKDCNFFLSSNFDFIILIGWF